MKQRVTNSVVRKINHKIVFDYIYECGPVSAKDIAVDLNLSLPTVMQNLKALQAKQLVDAQGTMDSTGGRKARAYKVSENAFFAAGFDITRGSVCLILLSMRGDVLVRVKEKRVFSDEDVYYRYLGGLLERTLEREAIPPWRVTGVGISVPAIISKDGAYTTDATPLGKRTVLLKSFEAFLKYPCRLFNDASAGGYSEFCVNDHPEPDEHACGIVYLSLSNTVGGAVMIHGKMYEGVDRRSAEFGHMVLHPQGRRCYCGQAGCAYAYVNTRLLSEPYGDSLDQFFEVLARGDARALDIWREYVENLTLLLNNIHTAYDCDIILGGYLGPYLAPYLETLRLEAGKKNTFTPAGDYIRTCARDVEASAIGAALTMVHLALQQI